MRRRWRRWWRWWRWWRGRWMVWLHMVLFGVMMTRLVVAMTMTMPMILMDKDWGGTIGIMVVQRIIHGNHFIVMEGLLNVMDRWYHLLLHHSLHHCHGFTIVCILNVVIVVIVLVVVVVIIHHWYSSCTRGDD